MKKLNSKLTVSLWGMRVMAFFFVLGLVAVIGSLIAWLWLDWNYVWRIGLGGIITVVGSLIVWSWAYRFYKAIMKLTDNGKSLHRNYLSQVRSRV
jgi:Co/Zn/Cd efflux system component